jgi:hypothetical protein
MRARSLARVAAFLVPLLAAVVLAGACAETRRALGEDCLKDQDCLSGICSQLKCAATPPYLDAEVTTPEAGPDGTVDSATEASRGDAPIEAQGESASQEDADAPTATFDSPMDAVDAVGDSPDSSVDATGDAPTDAPQDRVDGGG